MTGERVTMTDPWFGHFENCKGTLFHGYALLVALG